MSQHSDTSKNAKVWAVSQHTDTDKNAKVWAVSQHTETRSIVMRGLSSAIVRSLHNNMHTPDMETAFEGACGFPVAG